jgi:hypothetical protein
MTIHGLCAFGLGQNCASAFLKSARPPGWSPACHQPLPVAHRAGRRRAGRRSGASRHQGQRQAIAAASLFRWRCSPMSRRPAPASCSSVGAQVRARTNNARKPFTWLPGEEPYHAGGRTGPRTPRRSAGSRKRGCRRATFLFCRCPHHVSTVAAKTITAKVAQSPARALPAPQHNSATMATV